MALEAAVWRTTPLLGSWNIRNVMACRRIRRTWTSESLLVLAISANVVSSLPAGKEEASPNLVIAWRLTRKLNC